MSLKQVGMVGLGVMGQNLALNIADHGFLVSGYDAWPDPVDAFNQLAHEPGLVEARAGSALRSRAEEPRASTREPKRASVKGYKSLPEFVASIERPRHIIMLVKAGEVVDKTIAALLPLLAPGDLLIDGGNEFYKNTERRSADLIAKGFRYFGMGVSGGEEGARHGPSLMPGGDRAGYDEMEPMLTQIAAQADGACVTYIGPGGSGHYVKMVHNGIEYGDMQLIAEAYDVLKNVGGLSNDELADTFDEWNRGDLQSFLIEITANIFRKRDEHNPKVGLVDVILDAASMKGTGKWAVQEAAEIGAPIPVIASAVDARVLSSQQAERKRTRALAGPTPSPKRDPALVADVRAALYAAKACAYAQGMALLRAASDSHAWSLNLAELARIWTGGCIIRAQFLGRIKDAFEREPTLGNLLVDDSFQVELAARQDAFRRVVARCATVGIPLPAHASALAYYDMLRRERLPLNLTQAQRDYFGAHTYQRIDREGTFHTHWGDAPAT